MNSKFSIQAHYQKKKRSVHWDLRVLAPNKSYLFSQENILTFIINTHLGKYKNSTVDVISALTKMGLDKNIILPETKRFQSRSKLWISRFEIKPSKYALDINNNEHIQSQSRKDYIEKIVQIGTKSRKN